MIEITSRVRARAREANAKTAVEMPTTQKKFFHFFWTFFDFFNFAQKSSRNVPFSSMVPQMVRQST